MFFLDSNVQEMFSLVFPFFVLAMRKLVVSEQSSGGQLTRQNQRGHKRRRNIINQISSDKYHKTNIISQISPDKYYQANITIKSLQTSAGKIREDTKGGEISSARYHKTNIINQISSTNIINQILSDKYHRIMIYII